VSQHQVSLERVAAIQRPLGGFLAQSIRPQLRKIDQRGFEVLRHGRHQDVLAGLGVRLPQRGQHLRVTVQPKPREERRVMLDAVLVAQDLLLQGVEGFEARGGGGG
jgi:hypothetical protein